MSVRWINHKGKKILYVDYRGQTTNEEHFRTLEKQAEIMSSLKTQCLVLTNYEGTRATPEYMHRVRELGRDVFDKKFRRGAVLGITGLKRIILKGYISFTGHKIRAFDSEAKAIEWLVK
jgi:hypothetical protein